MDALLGAEILELALVAYGCQEAVTSRDVFLTVATNLEAFFVLVQADVGTKLFDVGTETNAVFAKLRVLHGLVARRTVGHGVLWSKVSMLITLIQGGLKVVRSR